MYEVKLHFKSALFSINYGRTSRLLSFYRISNNKNLTPKYLVNALTDLNTLKHQGRYGRKKFPWTILEEQSPVSRNTAASKIGNGVIS